MKVHKQTNLVYNMGENPQVYYIIVIIIPLVLITQLSDGFDML